MTAPALHVAVHGAKTARLASVSLGEKKTPPSNQSPSKRLLALRGREEFLCHGALVEGLAVFKVKAGSPLKVVLSG